MNDKIINRIDRPRTSKFLRNNIAYNYNKNNNNEQNEFSENKLLDHNEIIEKQDKLNNKGENALTHKKLKDTVYNNENYLIKKFHNILSKYNIKDDDFLQNYNLSLLQRIQNRIPITENNSDRKCAILHSKYGFHLPEF